MLLLSVQRKNDDTTQFLQLFSLLYCDLAEDCAFRWRLHRVSVSRSTKKVFLAFNQLELREKKGLFIAEFYVQSSFSPDQIGTEIFGRNAMRATVVPRPFVAYAFTKFCARANLIDSRMRHRCVVWMIISSARETWTRRWNDQQNPPWWQKKTVPTETTTTLNGRNEL